MNGFLIGLVVAVLLILMVAGTGLVWFLPLAAVIAVFVGVMAVGRLRRSGQRVSGPNPTGVPSTRDASYDPVQQP